ncbi:meteorin-like protein [Hyperolius riggenbachi]|uniref:meteorin-like protein n=1 Tax=Hyperolius riggenbachi TaxID=752182 RepID=UPI0035A38678
MRHWKTNSGLVWDSLSRAVQQVHLCCTEGLLEWLYPSKALRVILQPNLVNGKYSTVCIKPTSEFQGANMYVEKKGQLLLLPGEAGGVWKVHCFEMDKMQRVALFLQASPQKDLSRRTAGFHYEVLNNGHSGPLFHNSDHAQDSCRPCNDKELLMAICRNDFVVRGSIKSITHDVEAHVTQIDINTIKVYRQRSSIFQLDDASGIWAGHIRTFLQCGVKQGDGDFLFTGTEHFGNAWLQCAPRVKDFLEIYQAAKHLRTNPCNFQI